MSGRHVSFFFNDIDGKDNDLDLEKNVDLMRIVQQHERLNPKKSLITVGM